MLKKLLFFLLLFFLTIQFINSNELNKAIDNPVSSFSFNNIKIEPCRSSHDESPNLIGMGIAGIPLTILGGCGLIAGCAILAYYYTFIEPINTFVTSLGGYYPDSWLNLKWIGIGLLIGGGVFILVGIPLMIVGFAFTGGGSNKKDKDDEEEGLNTAFEFKNNSYAYSFVFKL